MPDDDPDLTELGPLCRPMMKGWLRLNVHKIVTYIAPCGRKLSTIEQVYKYLQVTKAYQDLDIDNFTFDNNVECMRECKTVKSNSDILSTVRK